MSETELPTGHASMEQEVGGRVPLPEWNPTQSKPKEYSRGDAGIVDAGNDLTAERGSTEPPLVEIVDKRQPKEGGRKFYDTVENAAHDLSNFHKSENAIAAAENLNELAPAVDEFRATWTGTNTEAPNFQPPLPGAQSQPDAQQAALVKDLAELQARALQEAEANASGSPQPESAEQPSTGIDPDFAALLEKKPQLRAQLEAPFQAAEQTRQAYTSAAVQIADVALSSVLANFPELQGVSGAELPTVLAFIQKQDPVKAQAIQNQLQQVNAVYSAAQTARAQQAQMEQAQVRSWAAQQDAAFDNANRGESKETIRVAAEEIVNFAVDHGISKEALSQLYATQPIMRSSVFQQMMLDAAKYRMAQRTATQNPASRGNIPPVMRPGIASSAGERSNVDLSELRNEFKRATGNEQIRLAAKLQRAQRRARG